MFRSLRFKIIVLLLLLHAAAFSTMAIYSYELASRGLAKPFRESLPGMLGLMVLTELLLGGLLFVLSQLFVVSRLRKIVRQTEQVAAGHFQLPPLPVDGRDELSALSVAVNRMTDNLRDLFEPFHTFIRHNDYAMLVTDSRFRLTSFNERATELLGYNSSEVLGERCLLRWHDLRQIRQRAEKYSIMLNEPVPADENTLFILSERGRLPEWEWVWLSKEGRQIPVSLNTSIMRNADGTIKGYVLIARDLTDLRRTADMNARLQEIIESAHDTIASFDHYGRLFYLNQEGRSFLGIADLNERTNLLSGYMSETSTSRFVSGLNTAKEQGYWQGEVEFSGQDGALRTASMIVVAHAPKDGGEPFFSTIVRDMSEQTAIANELLTAKQAADDANEAKSSFLARMSHEIRTPLSGIIGLTQLLRRTELSDLQRDYLEQIGLSSQSLLQMLNEVLDFSKLEADKLTIENAPFRLDESLSRLSATFAVLLGPKPIDFLWEVDPAIPATLLGDPSRLEQVLLNLGSNAIKFTNKGYIRISISVLRSTATPDRTVELQFEVADTGIGMKAEQLGLIFRPFVQADGKTSRKYGGTGLGLVISKALVEKMGGSIAVRSEHAQGSVFTVTVPLGIPETPSVSNIEADVRLRVLVLEDNAAVAVHWQRLLVSFGCMAEVANTWQQAQVHLSSSSWDVMFVDIGASDMLGEETWGDWKAEADARGVRLIAYTTLQGRDAFMRLPESTRPAAALVAPVLPEQLRSCLLTMSMTERSDPGDKTPALRNETGLSGSVLVIDDQHVNRIVATRLLEQLGLEAAAAESGEEAIRLVEKNDFALLFMDLHMPGMDGVETTVRLRMNAKSKSVPIVALTADTLPEQRDRCLAAGMNEVMLKPIEEDRLRQAVERWLPDRGRHLPPAGEPTKEPELEHFMIEGLDVRSALVRLDGKIHLYERLLDKFAEQYDQASVPIRQHLEAGDRASAVKALHSFRGAAGYLGAFEVQQTATLLEQAVATDVRKGDEWRLTAMPLLRTFEDQLCRLIAAIRQKRG